MTVKQPDLFDEERGKERRDVGMARAALANLDDLHAAREIARTLAQKSESRTVDADEVQKILIERGIELGNAAGSIFKSKEWKWTGEVRSSTRVSNHRRLVRVWRLVG